MAGKSASLAGAASDTADVESEHDENEVSTVKGEAEAATSKEDQLLEEAVVYIMEKKYPEDADSNRKRVIRKKAQKLSIDNGEIKYMTKKNGKVNFLQLGLQ